MTRKEATALIGKQIRNVWNHRSCLHRGTVTLERIDAGGCVYLRDERGKLQTYFAKVIQSWEVCS